ncbi:seryl-tRNA synthetase [Pancytospora epiphaga]|nr:seryl-tRNA synthetase [Pancytospora epiphaga]
MLDINMIRNEETRALIKESERNRFKDEGVVDRVYELYERRICINYECDKINGEINSIQKKIGEAFKTAKKEKKDVTEIVEELEKMKIDPKNRQAEAKNKALSLSVEIERLLPTIGNIIDNDVPICKTDEGNVVVRTYESKRPLKATRGYTELMGNFVNAAAGTNVIGHRGYYLQGKMAHLARALKNYAIDFLEERKYIFTQTPVMMKKDVMSLTAQLSDFNDQLFKIEDDFYLIATSEQPLTALFMNQKLNPQSLPIKLAGESLCFRKEAGAYGKANSGLFRVHQFEKIEQFVVCSPEESKEMHESLIGIAEEFYKSLEISFNVVLISSGELNDAAARKYDLEASFPNAGMFRELVSASNCTDYQSRSLNVGYGYPKEGEKPVYAHMLNSTLCAIQRTLCCIVENYQDGDKICVPDVLRKYTGFDEFEIY